MDSLGQDLASGKKGVDSYGFREESAEKAVYFFKKKMRKLHCSVYMDTQQLNLLPKRLREEVKIVWEPRIVKKWNIDERLLDPTAPARYIEVPYDIHYTVRRINNITGEHDLTGEVKRIVHPIWGYKGQPHPIYGYIKHITPDMMKIYDTWSDAFRSKEVFNAMKSTTPEDGTPVFKNEAKIIKMLQRRLPEAIVSAIPNSGLNSREHADIRLSFPKSYTCPTYLLEVKGVAGHVDNEVRSLSCHTKDNGVTNWAACIAHDLEYGTKTLCAYFDMFKAEVFLFDIQENYAYMGKKIKPSLSNIKGIMSLQKFASSCKKSKA